MEKVLEPEREGVMNLPTETPQTDELVNHYHEDYGAKIIALARKLERELAAAQAMYEQVILGSRELNKRLREAEAALAGLREDAQRLRWFVMDDLSVDEIGGLDLHSLASDNAIESGRKEPNNDDYLRAIRIAIDAAMQPSGGDSVHSANALSERPDLTPGDWISVNERLPVHNDVVIVPGGIALWRQPCFEWPDGKFFTLTGERWPGKPIEWEVTHWMPLPQPPGSRDALQTASSADKQNVVSEREPKAKQE